MSHYEPVFGDNNYNHKKLNNETDGFICKDCFYEIITNQLCPAE